MIKTNPLTVVQYILYIREYYLLLYLKKKLFVATQLAKRSLLQVRLIQIDPNYELRIQLSQFRFY